MCNNSCTECSRKIFSQTVSVVTVNDVDTLVIDVPEQVFRNNQRGCLVVIQSIPATATINMPVALSINGSTAAVYPLIDCTCTPVSACAIRTRRRYPFKVCTSATGGSFKILKNLSCSPTNTLNTIPAPTTGG
jgi:hypothetical protein